MNSQTPSVLDYALYYARQGISVFPCDPSPSGERSKRPLVPRDRDADGKPIPKTGGFYKATKDQAIITGWFTRWPRALIGLRMGREDGLFALDPDVPKKDGDADGLTAWRELAARHGGEPLTHTHITPSGGQHMLYRYPADRNVTNAEGSLPKGINVRGEGGYVIAPPSRMADGREYRFEEPEHAFSFAEPPTWLLDIIAPHKPEPEPADTDGPPDPGGHSRWTWGREETKAGGFTDSYVQAALDAEYKAASAPAQGRNNQLNKSAFNLGTLIGAGVLDASVATRLLMEAATVSGYIAKDGEDRARATIESGLTSGAAKPRKPPKARSGAAKRSRAERAGGDEDRRFIGEDRASRAFVDLHGESLLFCKGTGKWHEWTGVAWAATWKGKAFHWARLIARDLFIDDAMTMRLTTSRASFAASVERYCQSDPVFVVETANEWDADPWLLGTPGGTVDLRTGELRPANRADRITKLTAVAPAETPDCPMWLAFLNEATKGDAGYIRFLQQWAGYCLTGDTSEQALCFAYGGGGNGKGVLIHVLAGILKDYALNAAMETFTAGKYDRHPTELAALRGARLVTASETEQGRQWAESRIKQLTGGDVMRARYMRQDEFEFTPVLKLLIVGNNKPGLSSVDDAAKRRFNLLPFLFKPAVPDPRLEEKLKAEWPAILRWMIAGCLDWQANRLVRPDVVKDATDEYFTAQDTFSQWLEERCIVEKTNPYRQATSGELLASWSEYAKANGEPMGNLTTFGERMDKRGFRKKKSVPTGVGGYARGYDGIELRPTQGRPQ